MERKHGKCSHGVYWPVDQAINEGCQFCNPAGNPNGPIPVLPHSSADPLSAQRIQELDKCSGCGGIRTYSDMQCRVCGTVFPLSDARAQLSANQKQPGACPECNSTVHYETDKSGTWVCADCGQQYLAAKGKRG